MLFAALKLEKDKKKKNIDQVFAYGQCVKAGQRARVGKLGLPSKQDSRYGSRSPRSAPRSTGHASP
jgi:hypothetical protein